MDRRGLSAAAALLVCAAGTARAGHVVELGQYRYDPDALRPQLRIERGVDDVRFEVSGYPGDPRPGETVEFAVAAKGGDGPAAEVACTVHRVGVLGARRRIAQRSAADGRFRIGFEGDGEYEVTFAVRRGHVVSALSFPYVVGRPGSPWAILGGFGGGIAALVAGVAVAGRRRERRARR